MKEARKKKGLSQEALAREVGCSSSMIAKIEQGKKTPSMAMAEKIAQRLGKSVDFLFVAKK